MKEISMQDAARVMNYSDAYFCKLFKQCFDQNFTSYLTNFRVNEAKKLLKDRNISVKDGRRLTKTGLESGVMIQGLNSLT